ncbi:MinD-like ATPase involved in chromosome partitioning or flagellar assembly [Micromonospora luteifusca]|uniref:MinD-like ATPase involved in chromosome partitioning or flagellar assembly n=1 Tax=Micromonospora luteifusca TaxID=709860 RepID=A0ABS2LUN2_9ACTN|nr:chromosome partitioning protein [Micromonospora luteifusca]MBM7491845.1 MinD-like ATPase involved in chromosome partitioning or flagellar assembly [Micromonospora luteifusca]
MDENADRAQMHGQQPVPERDVEPLWPPDPADRGAGNAVPPWAAVAHQQGAPSPVSPGPVTPPVAAPSTGRPPVPGQPGAPAQPPPSPSDYPSLTGAVPPPGGWGVSGPSGNVSGWAPPQPSWPPPAAPAAASTPPAPPATGTPPAPPATGTPPANGTPPARPAVGAPESAGGPGGTGIPASPTSAAASNTAPAPTDRQPEAARGATGTAAGADQVQTGGRGANAVPPIPPGGVDLDLPFTLDHPTAADTPADRPTGAGAASADSATAGSAPQPGGTGEDGAVGGAARPASESPWAQPPQRPAGTPAPAHDEAATATPPLPAPPGPFPPHVGPGPVHPGPSFTPMIPGQAGPGHIPPPPDLTQFNNLPQQPPAQAGPATPPPGPFPPSPGWYPPPWQQGPAGVPPGQPYPEAEGVTRVPAAGYPEAPAYPDASWTPEAPAVPTAEDFSRRRQVRPADPVATTGVRAVVNKMGLLRLAPGRHEQERKRDIEMVRRNFGGLRQVTVVNPKGGAGKTVAILLLAMTFGQKRGGYVLAWDNNETQGTLGMRAQQDFHSRTVRDMLRDLGQFQGAQGRVGDLSQYVRSQGEGMFDVLASDESATGGEMLTAAAFAEIREVVSRFYKLIFVDTGNNVRAQNWQASMDATDQLVVTMSARNDSAETAARMLDHLEQSGRQRLVRQAVTVVSMPPSRKEIDLPAIQEHFAARTRAVLLAPYERLIDSGEPIRYGGLSSATRDAWLKIAAAVAEGL